MLKTFLVTGPTGSTGSKTVKLLLDAGARVRAFVHIEDERWAALAAQGAEMLKGDLRFRSLHISADDRNSRYPRG